jgi:hypothetical protein
MCKGKLFGALILKTRFFRVIKWAIDWRRFLMELVLRTDRTDDAEAGGAICYEAFKTIAKQHNFPPDFPSQVVAGLLSDLLAHTDVYSVTGASLVRRRRIT